MGIKNASNFCANFHFSPFVFIVLGGRSIGKLKLASNNNIIIKRGVNIAQMLEKRKAFRFCCLEINQQVWPAFKLLSNSRLASPRCVSTVGPSFSPTSLQMTLRRTVR